MACGPLVSAAACAIYDAINAASNADGLDTLARSLWSCYAAGDISDDDANFLSSCIDRRRPPGAGSPFGHLKPINVRLAARVSSRFTPRQRQRSSDRRASRDRRRMLGGSSVLPAGLRCCYTEGQRAVLCIIAGEVKRHGICDLPIDKIAALAGVCRTSVQTTLHEARRLSHIRIIERPQPGQKHLTNIIEIINVDWRIWLKRAPSARKLDRVQKNENGEHHDDHRKTNKCGCTPAHANGSKRGRPSK